MTKTLERQKSWKVETPKKTKILKNKNLEKSNIRKNQSSRVKAPQNFWAKALKKDFTTDHTPLKGPKTGQNPPLYATIA
jgi:hypothetical protein